MSMMLILLHENINTIKNTEDVVDAIKEVIIEINAEKSNCGRES
jgi:hypothetical protein